MQKTYLIIEGELDGQVLYSSDHIYKFQDDIENEGYEEIWNFNTIEDLRNYKQMDDLVRDIYCFVDEEYGISNLDGIRVIFCDVDTGFFGLSFLIDCEDHDEECLTYELYDWKMTGCNFRYG